MHLSFSPRGDWSGSPVHQSVCVCVCVCERFSYQLVYTRLFPKISTVEPPIKDTLNKEHLSIKDKTPCPNVSFVRRFHCILQAPRFKKYFLQTFHTGQLATWQICE